MISRFKEAIKRDYREAFEGASARILEIQGVEGDIAWYDDGPWDPWNHMECAMALHVMGEEAAGDRAFDYVMQTQKADGSWLAEYGSAVPMADETHMAKEGAPTYHDTNFAAYCAVGVRHHYLTYNDLEKTKAYWPMVERAIQFVLSLQSEEGDISWSGEAKHSEPDDAFRAGNSSIYKSLESAVFLADLLGKDSSKWRFARKRLGEALRHKPHRFDRARVDRSEFAMDWYYPILSGALNKEEGLERLKSEWSTFIEPGKGCRCVSTQPWITVAETCELVMAMISIGLRDEAEDLFKTQLPYANDAGAFWMGWQFEVDNFWPEELPSWTQGAVILAADALYGDGPASELLVRHRV